MCDGKIKDIRIVAAEVCKGGERGPESCNGLER